MGYNCITKLTSSGQNEIDDIVIRGTKSKTKVG